MNDADKERWRARADTEIAQGLKSGALVPPDAGNPAHARMLAIVEQVGAELGCAPAVYFAPTKGENDAQKQHNAQLNFGNFMAHQPNNTLVIPEAAHEFFTDGEIAAVLSHEIDHLKQGAMFGEKMSGLEKLSHFQRACMELMQQNAPPMLVETMQKQRNQAFEEVTEAATRFEIAADESAINSGRASDLIGALQKVMIGRYVGEDMDLLPPDKVVEICNDRYEHTRRANPAAAAGHSKETFVERLKRLEEAAEKDSGHAR